MSNQFLEGHAEGVSTAEMSEEKKRIRVDEAIQVSDLAHQMGQEASDVLRALWNMGMRGITINHAIDHEIAKLVAAEFGYTVENVDIGPFMACKGGSGNLDQRLEVFGGDGLDAMVVCSIGEQTTIRQEWSRFLLAEWCRGVLRWLGEGK